MYILVATLMVVGGSKMFEWHKRSELVHAFTKHLGSLRWDSEMGS